MGDMEITRILRASPEFPQTCTVKLLSHRLHISSFPLEFMPPTAEY